MTGVNETAYIRTVCNIEGDLTETLRWPINKQAWTKSDKENLVFFMIPGNPGVVDYYIEFLETIYNENDQKVEIFAAEHLGHSHGPHNASNQKLHSLQEQIEHKIKCFDKLWEEFTGNDGDGRPTKFILCGHSIGAHIAVQVLKARSNHEIQCVYALFPTLQHIAATPNGRILRPLFYERVINFSGSLVQLLRSILGRKGLRTATGIFTLQSEPYLSITSDKLLHNNVVKNALYMAAQEMEEVTELDEAFYRQNLGKFVFYFGQTDMWAPLHQFYDILRRFPDGTAFLCEDGMEHAFVLKSSKIMGQKVARWIKEPDSII